jgi:transposase, IS30 family
MVTLRERVTQYGIIVNLPDGHRREREPRCYLGVRCPTSAGEEDADLGPRGGDCAAQDLAAATGVAVFFAEWSSPWQRGANENYNPLVRQYIPKGTDLSVHSTDVVDHVMQELNTRPRRMLGCATPAATCAVATRNQVAV